MFFIYCYRFCHFQNIIKSKIRISNIYSKKEYLPYIIINKFQIFIVIQCLIYLLQLRIKILEKIDCGIMSHSHFQFQNKHKKNFIYFIENYKRHSLF